MKNKILKITSAVLAMVFIFSMAVYAEETDTITMTKRAVLSVSSTTAKIGDIVEIFVEAQNNPGIAAAGISVKYDNTSLKLTEVVDGGIWGENLHSPNLMANPYILSWFNPLITESITSDGVIATMKFEVLPNTKSGDYDIELYIDAENFDIIDSDMNPVDFDITNGQIKIDGIANDEIGSEAESNSQHAPESGGLSSNLKDEVVTDIDSDTRIQDAIFMAVGESTVFVNGKKTFIDHMNKQVVPYITNGRTMVPLRFVSESVSAEVLWEEGWDYCIIKKDDKEIKITFGSNEFTVNGEAYTYDAPIEVVMERTMVPVRFVSEHLGYDVYWNQTNQAVVITPLDNPWVENRDAEKTALMEMLVTIKGILP